MHGKRVALSLLSLALLATTGMAIPTSGESSGRYYLVEARDLGDFHGGVYVRGHERDLKGTTMDVNRIAAFLGYDLLNWFSIYGLVGYSQMKLENDFSWTDEEGAIEWGFGAWANLIDHDALDFNELCDRFRIQAAAQYSVIDNDRVTYGEFSANITFGIVNEVQGAKKFWPENIALYAGPCLNIVHCDDYDQERDDELGMVFGLDVQLSRRVSFGGSIEVYQDDRAYGGTVSVRF